MNNDFLFDDKMSPIFPETVPIDHPDIFPPLNEIASLSAQINRLNIDVHTQSLRIEVERVMNPKLRATLKRVKREIIPSNHIVS